MADEIEEEEVEYNPMSIGARNPYVYAEHKLKTKIDWVVEDKKAKLREAFEMEEYEKIFDPQYGSDLFIQTDVETGDMRPCNPVDVARWGPNGTNYTVGTRGFTDPVQGCLPDCYFIAALSSVAFAAAVIPKPELMPNKQPPYSFTFYIPPGVEGNQPQAGPPVPVTNLHPFDSNNYYPYSKSGTAGEIWVAMYEKAFARWVGGNNTDTPDYRTICQGDPMLALVYLTGWKFRTYIKTVADPDPVISLKSRYSTLDFTNGTQIFDKINSKCKTVGLGYRVAQFPMVAYTYDPRIVPAPPGVVYPPYTDATIVGNHSYSVLGVLNKNSTNYIVMRNPWGQNDPIGLPAGTLASGSWYLNTDLSNSNDAVFALRADVFKNYFKGFGWVYQ